MPLEFDNEICIKILRCPHICEKYVLKAIFVDGLRPSIKHSIGSYSSSQKTDTLQKLGVPRPVVDQIANSSTSLGQPHTYTVNLHKWNSRQGTINNVGTSRSTSLRRLHSGKGVEVVVVNDVNVVSLVNSTPTVVSTEPTDSLEKVPYCRVCQHNSSRHQNVN